MNPRNGIKIKRRKLPHWTLDGSVYFVTFRIREGQLLPDEVAIVLQHVRSGDPSFYQLFAAVVMPDHVHLLLRPNEGVELSRIMKGIKGVSARKVHLFRQTRMSGPPGKTSGSHSHSALWQDESFDRIVRDHPEYEEKLKYMYYNPVKRGVTQTPAAYPGWYGGVGISACQPGLGIPSCQKEPDTNVWPTKG